MMNTWSRSQSQGGEVNGAFAEIETEEPTAVASTASTENPGLELVVQGLATQGFSDEEIEAYVESALKKRKAESAPERETGT